MPSRLFRELMRPAGWHLVPNLISDPVVSFLMPTFGRAARQPWVLNEVVYWYTRQTYQPRELLILNDCPDQKLIIDKDLAFAENIRVRNLPLRCPSLGEKMNLMVMMAIGSICVVQEDDDISLPWRAEQAVRGLAEYDYFTPGLWWYAEGGMPFQADGRGVGHNCSAYRRAAMYDGYPALTAGHDAVAQHWALSNLRVNPVRLTAPDDLDEISYVYRFGVSDFHLGAMGDMERAYRDAPPGPPGTYSIEPAMKLDYVKLHREACGGS